MTDTIHSKFTPSPACGRGLGRGLGRGKNRREKKGERGKKKGESVKQYQQEIPARNSRQ
jgi:hypothetical protein